jgi:hypothetical protein
MLECGQILCVIYYQCVNYTDMSVNKIVYILYIASGNRSYYKIIDVVPYFGGII